MGVSHGSNGKNHEKKVENNYISNKTGNYKQTSKSNLIYYKRMASIMPSKKVPSFLLFSYDNYTYVFDLNLTNTKLMINSSMFDIYSIF